MLRITTCKQKKSSNLAIALIWFTAAISMAEILTGTWFAPLGWQQGLIAIVVGHFYWWFDVFSVQVISVQKPKKVPCKRYKYHLVKKVLPFLFTQCHATDGMDCCHDLYGG